MVLNSVVPRKGTPMFKDPFNAGLPESHTSYLMASVSSQSLPLFSEVDKFLFGARYFPVSAQLLLFLLRGFPRYPYPPLCSLTSSSRPQLPMIDLFQCLTKKTPACMKCGVLVPPYIHHKESPTWARRTVFTCCLWPSFCALPGSTTHRTTTAKLVRVQLG